MKVVVLGSGGQLGGTVAKTAAARHDVTAFDRRQLDVTDHAALRQALTAAAPGCIINCSAFSRVDEAEDEPVDALAVNAMAVRSLVRIASDIGATLVHYSTDFVFDGTDAGPNTEDRAPFPSGVYATSKLIGEWLAAETPRHLIFRVESLFGGTTTKSSIDAMLENILAGRPVNAFADRTVSPSYVVDVAAATLTAIERPIAPGLYHCVNSGSTTWLGVARELAQLAGRPDAAINPTAMAGLTMRVKRPLNAALSNAKLRAAGITMPEWQDALARHVRMKLGGAPS